MEHSWKIWEKVFILVDGFDWFGARSVEKEKVCRALLNRIIGGRGQILATKQSGEVRFAMNNGSHGSLRSSSV